MRHPSGRCCLSNGGVPHPIPEGCLKLAELFGLDISGGARGAERHARERAIGIVSQMAAAIVLSRAVSHVAHDHAGELTEVNRALPGS